MPAAAVSAAATVGSSLIGANASKKSSKAQQKAAQQVAQMQFSGLNQGLGYLSPYRDFGTGALSPLAGLLGYGQFPSSGGLGYSFGQSSPDWSGYLKANPDVLAEYNQEASRDSQSQKNLMALGITTPEQYAQWHYQTFGQNEGRQLPNVGGAQTGGAQGTGMNAMQAFLESIPGYQFAKQQGTQGALNALTSKGLGGVSGALGKGIGRFVTGLADQTYGAQIERLMNAAKMGQGSASDSAKLTADAYGNAGNAILAGAGARAGGVLGSGSALSGGLYGLGNNSQVTSGIGNFLGGLFGGGGSSGGWQGDPSGALAAMPSAAQIAGSW